MSCLYFSINSSAKSAGSTNNSDFNIALPSPITGVKDVRLASLWLPNVFQRIDITTGVNDTIDFSYGAGPTLASAVLPAGAYSGTTLAAAVAEAMNTASATTDFSATFNSAQNRITIADSAGNFSLLWASGAHTAESAASALGFLAVDLSGADSYTGDGSPLFSPSSVFVGCDTLGINVRQTAGASPISYAWAVPVTAPVGGIQTYAPITDTSLGLRQAGPFSSLHITLVDSTGTALALGNTNWNLALQFSTP